MTINCLQRIGSAFEANTANLHLARHLLERAKHHLNHHDKAQSQLFVKEIESFLTVEPSSIIIDEKEISDYAEHNERLKNQ